MKLLKTNLDSELTGERAYTLELSRAQHFHRLISRRLKYCCLFTVIRFGALSFHKGPGAMPGQAAAGTGALQ